MTAMAAGTAKLGLLRKGPEHDEALAQVREWTRERFKLVETAAILVAEIACGLPGCPPLETVVAFWTEDARRHQFKVFKPVREVQRDDLPFAWLRDSLFVPEGFGCDCC
jgi:nitrate reductase delta subunit